jgi:Protein of unknown function (DUF 659)
VSLDLSITLPVSQTCPMVLVEVRKKFYDILTTKKQVKEKKAGELIRLREEVNLNDSEGEGSENDEGDTNLVQLQNLRRRSKQYVGDGSMDRFCKLGPEEARTKGAREQIQSKFTIKLKEEKKDRACEYIAQWFYEVGIPHNAVTLPNFDLMLEAIGDYGRGLKGPTMYELNGSLLQKRKKKIQEVLVKHKETWELTGCSIMTDAWIDKKGRGIMNLMVHSASGVCFSPVC